ncbi:MAG: D-glycerate dehydrogenase [Pseudoruegeria sp.]
MNLSLLVTRPLPESVIHAIDPQFDVTVRSTNTPMTSEECATALSAYDAILPTLGDVFNADAFRATTAMRCRVLANFGVGYNHIDVSAAAAAGVVVSNTPGAVTDATSDIALTLILMTARRAGEGERLLRADKWEGWHPTQLLGRHVTGATLGVIGMGRIGKAIAKRGHYGFDMPVVFFNRSKVEDPGVPAQQLPTITDVLKTADFVVLAVPASADTLHLIGAAELSAMRSDGYLINISRGNVIDEAALVSALKTGEIAGAGLDVYEFEPNVPKELAALEQVTLLPHLGTAALNVRTEMGMMAVSNLKAFVEGADLPNRV